MARFMEKLEQHEDGLQMRLGTLKSEHMARDDHFSRRLEAITEDLTKAVTSARMAGDRLALNERRIAELQAQVPALWHCVAQCSLSQAYELQSDQYASCIMLLQILH